MVKRIPIKTLKLALMTVGAYVRDKSGLRATALTLNTLLSIVPVLALLFGIAKGFGMDRKMEKSLMAQFPEQQEVLGQALLFARRAIDNAQGGVIAGAGVLFLIYSVIRVISEIEKAMNHIWSISKPRSIGRKFSDYLSLILVGPFLILGSSSLNVFIATLVNRAAEAVPFSDLVGPVGRIAIHLLPVILLWILFTFVYVFLPNTKVKIVSGLIGGALAALTYQAAQTLYISLQVGVSRSSAIYGSFAALPLFIMWLEVSWSIVLFGAELTHQHQNYDNNEKEENSPELSFRAIKRISLDICAVVFGRFGRGEAAATGEEISSELELPSRVSGDILNRLVKANVLALSVRDGDENESVYQPARDVRFLGPVAIVSALERQGQDLATLDGVKGKSGEGERILQGMESRMEDKAST